MSVGLTKVSNSRKRPIKEVVPDNGLDEILAQPVDKYEQQFVN